MRIVDEKRKKTDKATKIYTKKLIETVMRKALPIYFIVIKNWHLKNVCFLQEKNL